jgi:hypothetical protein
VIATALALALLAPSASADLHAAAGEGAAEYAQLTIRERVILRIQTLRGKVASPAPQWTEKKGPRCMTTDAIGGAAVTESDSVDFVLKGGTRLRAELDDDCPAIDYDGGFYLAPTKDKQICAGRDSIHARSGGECAISRFRTLVPAAK